MIVGAKDTARQVLVIAEIGNNHEGDAARAADMVGMAAEAGADAVKFQAIAPERLVDSGQADRLAQLRRICLPLDAFADLAAVARAAGVECIITPFDPEGVALVDALCPAIKIASGDNTFFPLIRAAARTAKPILLSTGLADEADLTAARSVIARTWAELGAAPGLALLHCVSAYPTPPAEANLAAIRSLAALPGVTPGYSDHTLGVFAAVLAVAAGARIVEKHFTLDKTRQGFRDHQLSADPTDLREMVARIREAEELLGHGRREPGPTEAGAATALRRSIAAARDLQVGHVLAWEDLSWVRPGTGLAPGSEERILGRALARPVRAGALLAAEDLAPGQE